MSLVWPSYTGPKWDGKPENIPMFFKNFIDYTSQPFPFEDPQPQAHVKSWNVSPMGFMYFRDQVPECCCTVALLIGINGIYIILLMLL